MQLDQVFYLAWMSWTLKAYARLKWEVKQRGFWNRSCPLPGTTVSPAQQAPWGCECPLLIPKATLSVPGSCSVLWPQSVWEPV